jgi:hypothetical protein
MDNRVEILSKALYMTKYRMSEKEELKPWKDLEYWQKLPWFELAKHVYRAIDFIKKDKPSCSEMELRRKLSD